MKKILAWVARVVGTALSLILVVVLFPYVSRIAADLLPDPSANGMSAVTVLSQKIEQTARLETYHVQESGVLEHDFLNVLGTYMANVTVHYEYTASVGIDLSKAEMQLSGNRVTLILPQPEILHDSLVPKQTVENTFWAPQFGQDDFQALLDKKKAELRQQYIIGADSQPIVLQATYDALDATIAKWLEGVKGNVKIEYKMAEQDPT